MHLLDMQSFNSTIFNVPRLFIALRYNLVSPHPHVQPVPRAEPAMQQPWYNLVYDNDQMGIRHLCILYISNLASWYYIRSSWASPFALNVIFLPLTTIYRNTTCLTQNDYHQRTCRLHTGDQSVYAKVCCLTTTIVEHRWCQVFPYSRKIR